MDIQDILSNPQIIQQLARGAGVGEGEAKTGLSALLPAITQGLLNNSRGADGLESLAKALDTGAHDRYVDQPEVLADPRTQLDGNAILGHVFGSKEVSRAVAGRAAQSTGLDSTLLKQMLPIVASLAMGALSKGSDKGRALGQAESGGSGGTGMIGALLGGLLGGANRDPANDSPIDDVLDLAKRFF